MTDNHVQELKRLEGLLQVSSINEMQMQLTTLVDTLGFDHFACGVMNFGTGGQGPSVQLLSCYPGDWQAHYNANGYFEQDAVIVHTIHQRKPLPLIWAEPGTLENPVHNRIFAEAADFGLRGGLTVSCQGSSQTAVLSLSSGLPRKHLGREMPHSLGTAQLIACYLQEVWVRFADHFPPYKTSRLSKRELECLHWAAVGKTSWEISNILNISERTVVFHIGRVVEKLDVSNRRQAVARGITLGLINP